MKGPPPLTIELGRSRLAAAFVVVAYLATATLFAFLPGALLYRELVVLLIGAHALWTLRSWALRTTPGAVIRVELDAEGLVTLCEKSGRRCEGRLQPSSYVGTSLVTMVVRIDGVRYRSRSFAILPDMLPEEDLRRLRVLMRVAGSNRSLVTSAAAPATPRRR